MEETKRKTPSPRKKRATKIGALLPLFSPTEEAKASKFQAIRQGPETNTLTKVKALMEKNTAIDPITRTATITQGELTVVIPDFLVAGLKTSAYKLLDAITIAATKEGVHGQCVSFSIDEYMQWRELKDKKETRKQVIADLETLFNAKISFKRKSKKSYGPDFADMRIIESKGIQRGVIHATFSSSFLSLLQSYPIMLYPALLPKINDNKNPNSYSMGRKIAELKKMNLGKSNEDIISVKTLLLAARKLPSYEDVLKTDKAIGRRIIDPFERDMDALEEILSWEYCHKNGTPLTDKEIASMTYETFIGLNVKITWKAYPDQTEWINKREKARKKAKRAQKKGVQE